MKQREKIHNPAKIHDPMEGKKKFVWLGISAVVTGVFFLVIGLIADPVYGINDDLMIQSILSGKLSGTPSGMAVYLSVPLSSLLSLCYRIFPKIPWLGVFFIGCYILSFFVVLWSALKSLDKNRELTGKRKILSVAVVCLMECVIFGCLFYGQFLMLHYTVAAAVVGGTALFAFLVSGEDRETKTSVKQAWFPVVLLLLCYLIRVKVFYMLLPFLAAAVCYRMLKTNRLLNDLVPLSVLAAGFLLLFGMGKLCYGSEEWQAYLAYNEGRTKLYDYVGIWEGDEAETYYQSLGYSQEEMAIYKNYNILLNENLTAEDFERMASFSEQRPDGQRTAVQKLKDGVWLYKERLFQPLGRDPYQGTAVLLYGLILILIFAVREWRTLISLAFLWVARSALWIYLLMEGRYPERVTVSLCLAEIMVLFALLWNLLGRLRSRETGFSPLGAAVSALVLAATVSMGYFALSAAHLSYQDQVQVNAALDKVYDAMREHPDNLYLLDVYATVYHTTPVLREYDSREENDLLLGGWAAGSPHVREKLEEWGYSSAFDALEGGRNVYLVLAEGKGMSVEDFETYGLWRTGSEMKLAPTKTIETEKGTFVIYQVEKGDVGQRGSEIATQ